MELHYDYDYIIPPYGEKSRKKLVLIYHHGPGADKPRLHGLPIRQDYGGGTGQGRGGAKARVKIRLQGDGALLDQAHVDVGQNLVEDGVQLSG